MGPSGAACQFVEPASCDRRRRSGGANGIPLLVRTRTKRRGGAGSAVLRRMRKGGMPLAHGDITRDSHRLEHPPGPGRAAPAAGGARCPHGATDRAGRFPRVPGRWIRARGHSVRLPRHRPRPFLRGERGDPSNRRRLAPAGGRRRRERVRRREERDAHGPWLRGARDRRHPHRGHESPITCGQMGKREVSVREMEGKIGAALAARRNADTFFLARTDGRGAKDVNEAIRRGTAYRDAGADGPYIEGLRSHAELTRVGKALEETPLATTIMEGGGRMPWPSPAEIHEAGFAMIITRPRSSSSSPGPWSGPYQRSRPGRPCRRKLRRISTPSKTSGGFRAGRRSRRSSA
jgi:Phosphoenolpyruvate phosphomutase